jgi:hypothetical protein
LKTDGSSLSLIKTPVSGAPELYDTVLSHMSFGAQSVQHIHMIQLLLLQGPRKRIGSKILELEISMFLISILSLVSTCYWQPVTEQ